MIRGRVVAAPQDLADQQAKHDERYGLKADPDPMDLTEDKKRSPGN